MKRSKINKSAVNSKMPGEASPESMEQTLHRWVRQCHQNPKTLLEKINHHGTPFWLINQATVPLFFLLKCLGYGPGFILPTNHWRFRLLSWTIQQCQRIKGSNTPLTLNQTGCFILPQQLCRMGFLAHQAFHWASFHKGTPGYSPVAQKTYHRYWDPLQGHFRPGLHRLSEHELLQLQAAVRQEQKALVFVKTITDQVLIPGQQAASLAKGTTSA